MNQRSTTPGPQAIAERAPRSRRRWRTLAWAVLLTIGFAAALILVGRHLLLPHLDRFAPQLEALVSERLGVPVRIESLRGHLDGLQPAIEIGAVRIADGELFEARGLAAVLDWRSLWLLQPVFERLHIDSLAVRIERLGADHWQAGGRDIRPPVGSAPSDGRWPLPPWLLESSDLHVRQITIDYRDRETGERAVSSRMSLDSTGRRGTRQLRIEAPALEGPGGHFTLRARLGRDERLGGLVNRNWFGDAYFEYTGFDAGALVRLLRRPVPIDEGLLHAQGWFNLHDNRPRSARLALTATGLRMSVNDVVALLPTARADLETLWQGNGDLELRLRDARATDRTGTEIALGEGPQRVTFDPKRQLSEGEFSLRGFDARRLLTFARELPFPPDMLARAQPLVVDGQVQELSMRFDARGAPSRYQMSARFTGLSASYDDGSQPPPVDGELNPGWPSFESLDGSVQVSEKNGRLSLRGTESAVTLPGILTRPRIPLDHFRAELDWQVQASATDPEAPPAAPIVDVYLRDIEFGNADGEGRIKGTYRRVPGTFGQIDLTSEVTGVPLPRLGDYLPLTLLGDVREWLRQAAVSGTADSLKLRVRGQLHDFPFRQPGNGEFQMRVDMSDVNFRYGRDWPIITGATGMFSLQRGGMTAQIDQGRVFDTRIRRATFAVPDFRQPVLEVNGRFDGPAQQVVRYINESPIGRRLDGFFEKTRLSGQARTDLLLKLPLRNFDDFTITGESQLNGSRLELAEHLPVFDAIQGKLRFTENGLAFDKVQARLLGGPVTLDAVSPRRGLLEIDAQGRASAEGLRRFADTPITRQLDGSTRYRAGLTVDRGAVSLDVRTNLAGMRSRLPPPFDKEADVPAMLNVALRPLERGRDGRVIAESLRLDLRDDAHLLFARRADERGRLRVRAGTIAVGQKPVLPASGLSVETRDRPVDVDAWWSFVTREVLKPSPRRPDQGYFADFDLRPDRLTVVAPRARYAGRDFHSLVAGVSRQQDRWQISARADELDGHLIWSPAVAGRSEPLLTGRFDRLHIPEGSPGSPAGVAAAVSSGPDELPAMDIVAREFVFRGRPLGRLILQAENPSPDQWRINRLSLESEAARVASSGVWQRDAGASPQVRLDFDIDSLDSGRLLDVLGFADTLRAAGGKLNGQLRWHGSPVALDLPSLNGRLSMALGRGQFLKTDPGMAKLIGVLSLQSLARRLTLDFSDVFEKGFAFDAIVGEVDIDKGTASTRSLLMNGVQAQVLISGSADTVHETQDLLVEVLPTVNAGLASLAYAAMANPAVGIGTLLAQMLLETPLRKLFSYEFWVTGPWANPDVKQIAKGRVDESDAPSF